ncbi:MAG: hypothetical protein ACO24P_07040 [Candidatus Nanopelagicaceae bacterium]
MPTSRRRKDPYCIATAVRIGILVWSAGLLTASYMNVIKNPDEAFIASIFTGTLATFGIDRTVSQSSNPKESINRNTNTSNRTNSRS